FFTNVFNLMPEGNNIESLCTSKAEGLSHLPALSRGKFLNRKYAPELDRLFREIESLNPNVIVALGSTATWALLRDNRIKRLRGAPTIGITGHKVFPTYNPAAVLRDFKLRPIVFSDFGKIAVEATYPEVRRPEREFWLRPSLENIRTFEHYIK